MLAAARLMLGLAQGGTFPAAAKAVAEWFPARERATAMGMVNGGSSVGAVFAPPAVALVLCHAPWPWVFYLSGAIGLLWAAWWLWDYYPPAHHPRLSAEERREIHEVLVSAPRDKSSVSWWRLLVLPEVWGMLLGKACCDALWFTYIAWLPKYLVDMRGFDNAQIGSIAWIPYAASGFGSVVGGWCSSRLLLRGYSLNFSRKAVLGACAARDALHVPGHARAGPRRNCPVQHRLLRPSLLFHADDYLARRPVPAGDGRLRGRTGRIRWFDGRDAIQ